MSSRSWATGNHAVATCARGRPGALYGGRFRERTATSFPGGCRSNPGGFGASRDRIHRRKRRWGRPSASKTAASEEKIARAAHGNDLHPFCAARHHGQHSRPGGHDPHIMLQLGHILLRSRFLRERPRQHELRLENRPGRLDPAVQGDAQPSERRVPKVPLDVRDHLTGICLIPTTIKILCREAELDDKVAGEILRLDLASFSRQRRRRAASSSPMMIRASEPPMNWRLSRL
jgi:hypothetical protein